MPITQVWTGGTHPAQTIRVTTFTSCEVEMRSYSSIAGTRTLTSSCCSLQIQTRWQQTLTDCIYRSSYSRLLHISEGRSSGLMWHGFVLKLSSSRRMSPRADIGIVGCIT